jgi:hypothetical protein
MNDSFLGTDEVRSTRLSQQNLTKQIWFSLEVFRWQTGNDNVNENGLHAGKINGGMIYRILFDWTK